MQEEELKNYENIGNWSFEDISYTVEQETTWGFYNEIKSHSSSNSLLLDLGTGGGEKALSLLPDVGMIIATDFSEQMIKTANINKKSFPNKKIKFVCMNNLNINFPDNLFDIVSARHTIIDAKQIYNVLRERGFLIIEGVDKYDCWDLKKIFNRGQAFNDDIPISKNDYYNIKDAGFSKVSLQEIIQYEYYKTPDDLLALLLKTPILNNFSDEKIIETNLFNKYISEHTTAKGIELKRILYGIVAQK